MTLARSGRRTSGGYSLLEMMVAVAVAGLLSAIAYPNYLDSVRKSRRADALQALRNVQLVQEKWRANHASYGTLADLGIGASSPDGWYTVAISNPTAVSYTATATAVAGKSQTADTAAGVSCATLSVNQDAPVFNPAGQTACWGR